MFVTFAGGNTQRRGWGGLQKGRGISDPRRNAAAFL